MRPTIVNSEKVLQFLKENTKNSWYWIGFLLASKTKNNLFFIKSEQKIQELSLLINKKTNKHFLFTNDLILEFLMSICKNPNHLISNEKVISLLIGIFDAKGSITFYEKKNTLSLFLEITKDYENLILKILQKIFELSDEVYNKKITYKKENIRLYLTNPIVISLLIKKASEYNLPLTEKWEKINNYSSKKYEKQRKREILLPALIEQGYSLEDLSQTLEMSKPNVCRLLKRLKK